MCDTEKAVTQYMVSETKYKMRRYILKIGKTQIDRVLLLQRNVLSSYKNWGFFSPLIFQDQVGKGLYAFPSTHKALVEKETIP